MRGGVMSGVIESLVVEFDAYGVDVIWQSVSAWADGRWAAVTSFFDRVRSFVEPAIWVVGSILALVPGTFAIYKWIYYRYSRLPYRLEEFLLKEEARLEKAKLAATRSDLLGCSDRPNPIGGLKAPIFVVPNLQRALRRLRWGSWFRRDPLVSADRELESALTEIEQKYQLWQRTHEHYKRQQAVTFLLKGAIWASKGRDANGAGKSGVDHSRKALGYFVEATKLDERDVEAWEYAGHQYRVLGEPEQAVECYAKIVEITEHAGPEKTMERVRALRFLGEALDQWFDLSEVKTRLGEARVKLEEADKAIPPSEKGGLEQGFVHVALARVHRKQQLFGLAKDRLDRAELVFSGLMSNDQIGQAAKSGLQAVRNERNTVTATQLASTAVVANQQLGTPQDNRQARTTAPTAIPRA